MAIIWKVDPAHSQVRFEVRHLLITTVTGFFRRFQGEMRTETPEFDSVTALWFTADINSIDTNNAERDAHLKSADFLDLARHNEIRFDMTRYESLGREATLQGDLTIAGNTRPVSWQVLYTGSNRDEEGRTKAGFSVSGKISRKDFGLIWNAVTEMGSAVVGDEITVHAEIQLAGP